MNAREFEEFVRAAWTDTSAPLTNESLQRMSGLPRSDVEHLARGLMRKGVVDMEVTSTGAIAWSGSTLTGNGSYSISTRSAASAAA